MDNEQSFLDAMQKDIENLDISEDARAKLLQNLLMMKSQKINLMITGGTGCGKSSTINALFGCEKAKVGVGVDPETMEIERYPLGNLILWDTPGLGDGKEADARHKKAIVNKLMERDENGDYLIDLVLVILDGSSRDMGSSFELINNVIIPYLGENKENRILVAINQADVAMKGRYWNYEENRPEPKLVEFLEQKVASVQKRIRESSGVNITPIYYSAGIKEEGEEQKPYNLTKLLHYIVKYTPEKKRIVYIDHINQEKAAWESNDNRENYGQEIAQNIGGSFRHLREGAAIGSTLGAGLGSIFGLSGGVLGKALGSIVGGGIGAVIGLFKKIF